MSQSDLPNEIRVDVEALLNGTLDESGVRRLETSLLDNPVLQRRFLDYCQLHTDLGLSIASDRALEDAIGTMTQPIANETMLGRVVDFFARPTPLSMTVAALFIGLLLTVMAFMVAPFYRHVAGIEESDPPQTDSKTFVAELTAVHLAIWSSDQLEPSLPAHLQAGRQMQLEQGLAELEFRDGASVVIEGPATWVVESESVLRMESGQLTAHVPPQAVGFTVRLPHVEVVDLGTRFGAVARSKKSEVHVFAGEVEAAVRASGGDDNSLIRLTAGESIVWNARVQNLTRQPSQHANFVRQVPRLERFTAHSTGVEVAVGQPDPNWLITKAIGDPSFLPQRAVVCSVPRAVPNDVSRSQWISSGQPPPVTPGEATYTYQTKFDLSEFDAASARLQVRFAVDNLVTAIRINDQPVLVPKHEYGEETFKRFFSLAITEGFRPGENTLELDVFNANDNSYMGLHVALVGYATRPIQRGDTQD